jgi:hypothetical protein
VEEKKQLDSQGQIKEENRNKRDKTNKQTNYKMSGG